MDFSPFLTKGVDWTYETEWRMMLPFSSASTVIGDGSTAVHLYEFPISAVRSLTLGCRMTESKEEEIRRILSDASTFKDVLCLKAQIDETHYRLRFTESCS